MTKSTMTAALVALLATTTALSSTAHAQEGEGGIVRSGFGLGLQSTLSGRGALEFDYHANTVTFNALAGLSFFSPDQDGADSNTYLVLGLGAFFNLHQHGRASFHLGGRVVFSTLTNQTATGDDGTQTDVELPLRVRLDVSQHLSLTLEVGLSLNLGGSDAVPPNNPADPMGVGAAPADGNNFTLGAGNLFGAAGLTMYF